jgi:anti-anti-sigma regulatory factor
VLRITTLDEQSTSVSLKVEGRVSSETCDDLERTCHSHLQEGKLVQLDLSEVSFVDPSGVQMLRALQAQPVCFIFVPSLISELIGKTREY